MNDEQQRITKLQTMISYAPVTIFSLDATGNFIWAEGQDAAILTPATSSNANLPIFDKVENAVDVRRAFYQALAGEMSPVVIELPEATLDSWFYPRRNEAGEMIGVIGMATNVTELKDAEAQLHRSDLRFQDLINATSVAFSSSRELKLVLQAVVDWLAETLKIQQCTVALFDQERKLTIFADHPAPGQPSAVGEEIIWSSGSAVGRVMQTQAPVAIYDARHDPLLAGAQEVMIRRQIKSLLVLPLIVGDKTIGTIGCDVVRSQRHFSSREIQLAQTAANLVSTRVEQARLFEQVQAQTAVLEEEVATRTADLQQANQRLQVVNTIGRAILEAQSPRAIAQTALSHLRQLVPFGRAAVILFDFDAGEGTILTELVHEAHAVREVESHTWPLEEFGGIDTLAQGQIYRVDNIEALVDPPVTDHYLLERGVQAYLSAPLLSQGELIGSLNVDQAGLGVFGQGQEEIIQEVAYILSVVLQQAQLREALERQAEQLEEQVEARTAALTAANQTLRREISERQQLEKRIQQSLTHRTRQVQTSTEVAQEIATAPDLEVLFRQVVNLVKKRFGYYHTQVYALEADQLVMREGTGEAGRKMKQRAHAIPLQAKKSLVARAAVTGRPALAPDVHAEPDWLPNSLLPETRSEIAVPIMLKDEVLGVLDVQSDVLQGISQEDELLLMGLCGQIAVAINNRRLEDQRIAAEQALKAYTKELERSNRELENFAYVASHDLQEPLRKIRTFGDRLNSRYRIELDERGQDYLKRMESAAARMQALINDLLTFSRVTTRAQPFTKVDLKQLVQDVLLDLEVSIDKVNGRIEVDDLPIIEAEPTQMRQLLQNLISNALKFHRPDAPPVVKIYSQVLAHPPDGMELEGDEIETDYCKIFVEDNGIGFDEKYLDRIFSVFQRLHGRSHYEGTGVGLALCRKIVERHRGAITARSKKGNGATFIVTIPMEQY